MSLFGYRNPKGNLSLGKKSLFRIKNNPQEREKQPVQTIQMSMWGKYEVVQQ